MQTRSLKILITTGIFPPDIGGPATYVPRIAAALAGRGHRVTVVAPMDRGIPDPVEQPAYRLVRFPRPKRVRYLNFFVEMGRAVWAVWRESRHCDVIFHNGLGIAPVIASSLRRRPLIVKIVGDKVWEWAITRGWTAKNLDDFQTETSLKLRFLRWFHHAPVSRAATIIVPSRYLAEVVKNWGNTAAKTRVVYNAFHLPEPPHEDLPPLPASFADQFCLVTVGRLIPHKRVDQIIWAVQSLDGVALLMIGDGLLRSQLEAQVMELGLSGRVHFTGQIPPAQVAGYLKNRADAFVLNSTYEGLPHVLLEAIYFEVPIIATAVGGTVEVVENDTTGLLINPAAPQELESAIQKLAGDPNWGRELAANAKTRLPNFSFEALLTATEAILVETAQ